MRCLSRPAKVWSLVACLCIPSLSVTALAADPAGKGAKKAHKDLAAQDGLENTLSWEDKVMGPETTKKIDHRKIEALQAAEKARREKEEKNEKERREREAAMQAQRKDVAAPASHEVQVPEEAPQPVKPAVKHDDAFVDKLLNDKGGPKKKASGPDDVDQLLAKVKDTKGAPSAKRNDSVDQILTTADKEPAKVTVTRPSPALATRKSDEEAAREEAMRALAAAQAKLAADRAKQQRQQPAIPDAAVMRARAMAASETTTAPKKAAAPTLTTTSSSSSSDSWNDPFSGGDHHNNKGPAPKHGIKPARGGGDPFDGGGGKARPAKGGKGQKKTKDPNWNDPFA